MSSPVLAALPGREIGLVACVAVALYLLLALGSYSPMDPALTFAGTDLAVSNLVGSSGAVAADAIYLAFGWPAHLLPAALAFCGVMLLRRGLPHARAWPQLLARAGGFVAVLIATCVLARLHVGGVSSLPAGPGGAVGDGIVAAGLPVLNWVGLTLCAMAALLVGSQALLRYSWLDVLERTGRGVYALAHGIVGCTASMRFGDLLAKLPKMRAPTWRRSVVPDAVQADDVLLSSPMADVGARRAVRGEAVAAGRREPTVTTGPASPAKPLRREPVVAARRTEPAAPATLVGEDANPVVEEAIGEEPVAAQPSAVERSLPDSTVEVPTPSVPAVAPPLHASTAQAPPAEQQAAPERAVAIDVRPPPAASESVNPLPDLGLLEDYDRVAASGGFSKELLEDMSRLLEERLADFRVEAKVVSALPGPVVTRFELEPAKGTKVSKISALAKDLARSLAVVSVRIVEVIPGKSVVGIEIPNEQRETVRLKEILDSRQFRRTDSPLTLALGKDIAGVPVMADIGKMPHLLVAGTTGSGKSVSINAMLLSMLYKATPEELRLILVDPKMLELAVYDGIPHLLTPVVTDMKDAAQALNWCVAEMERRYQLMAALGVRNLGGYNKRIDAAEEAGEALPSPLPENDGEPLAKLPYIVVVIDEFADMMMIVGKKVEQLIARIAQKARAAGIHLLLATQRPSVDVITGLIKANIPARVAFQVSSKIDSRTILDQGGAEQLLGHGDMLFLPPGTSMPMRVHGAFVSDEEVHAVAADRKSQGEPDYIPDLLEGVPPEAGVPGTVDLGDDAENKEPLYDEAVAFVLESRRASISAVQRKLRIGYNRAARLIETMEQAGVVSAMDATGGREVLVPQRAVDGSAA